MKLLMLTLATLGACSSPPAAGFRAGPAATTSTSTSTTTMTASSTTTTTPSPSTIAVPVSPPLNPPELEGGTTSASWYGDESGTHTASGDRYDPDGLTFAHRAMPFGTAVRFCRAGACVVATCSDRGPATWTGRDFDLSRATFGALAPLSAGVATVTWERLA